MSWSPKEGQKTFILIARYPGSANPTRRALGEYPSLSLEKARERARDWRVLIRQGNDPKAEEDRQRRLELRKQETTLAAVAEDYIDPHVRGQRKAKDTEREICKELIGFWGERPITSITREDVIALVEAIAKASRPIHRSHHSRAHSIALQLGHQRGAQPLETSPCDRIKPAALIGAKEPRQRVLNDAEIAAVWRGSEALGYPFGPLYQLLLLTGARMNEVAGAKCGEFDLKKKICTVPPERFKLNASHLVPLSTLAVTILEGPPRFTKGDHLFTTTYGEKPISGFSKGKARIDKLVKRDLALTPVGDPRHSQDRSNALARLRSPIS